MPARCQGYAPDASEGRRPTRIPSPLWGSRTCPAGTWASPWRRAVVRRRLRHLIDTYRGGEKTRWPNQNASHPRKPTPSTVVVALVQMTGHTSKAQNVDKAISRIAEAAAAGANIVCLQELFAGQYLCQTEDHSRFDEAEPIPGPTSTALARAAAEHGVVIVGSLFERRAAGLYHNTALIFDADGSTAGMYRKMHIPDDPLYYEKFYFTPGDLGFRAFDTRFGRIGTCVCWDQWYPEAARLTALAGAADHLLSDGHRLA